MSNARHRAAVTGQKKAVNHKQRASKVLAGAGLSALTLGAVMGGAVPAQAASGVAYHSEKLGYGKYMTSWGEGSGYLGSLSIDGKKANSLDEYAFCVDWKTTTDYSQMDHTNQTDKSKTGDVINALISIYGNDTDLHPEIAVAVHHLKDQTRGDDSNVSHWGWAEKNDAEIRDELLPKAEKMIAAAQKYVDDYMGKYSIKPTITVGSAGNTATVDGLQVKSTAGNNVTTVGGQAVKLTLTLTGDATFANGTKTITVNPGDEPKITANSTSNISVKVTSNEVLLGDGVTVYNYEAGKNQDKVLMSNRVSATGTASARLLVPTLGTTAVDAWDKDKTLYFAGGNVDDTVAYKDLVVGDEYELRGKLVDKATGKDIGVSAEKTFTPKSSNGSEVLSFKVPEGYDSKNLVVFEYLYKDNVLMATHADINDAGQTVSVAPPPTLKTTASDVLDGDKTIAQKGGTVQDAVKYTDLKVNTEYTISGELMIKGADGKAIKTGLVATKTFTPKTAAEAKSGTQVLTFDVPAEIKVGDETIKMAGQTVVAFEDLIQDGKSVTLHADINDKGQTVYIADLGTVATDKLDGDHNIVQRGGTVVDTLEYKGLTPGQEYTVQGELMDKATGKTTGLTKEIKFTPTTVNGTVNVEFELGDDQAGKTLVAFETISQEIDGKAVIIAEHKDIEDEKQTVLVADLHTLARDDLDGDHYVSQTDATVTDDLVYTNLVPNQVYKVYGKMIRKATDQEILDAAKAEAGEGAEAPTEVTDELREQYGVVDSGISSVAYFRADTSGSGTAHIQFEIGDEQAGQTLTMYERAVLPTSGDAAAVKFVEENPVAEGITDPGLPEGEASETDGTFDAPLDNEVVVATHNDPNSAEQTVYVPEIGTTATDSADGDKNVVQKGGKVVDTVEYTNLAPGKKYIIEGELMDKDGKPTGIKASGELTPEKPNGTYELTFDLGDKAAGQTLVAFEYVYQEVEGKHVKISSHEDINDEKQTVVVANIGTKALDKLDGDKNLVQKDATVTDTIKYENLVPGEKYVVEGELMDKATGESTGIKSSGEFKAADAAEKPAEETETPAATQSATPTESTEAPATDAPATDAPASTEAPSTDASETEAATKPATDLSFASNGTWDLDFKLDDKQGGKTLVAYERVYHVDAEGKKTLVAEHADINDAAQTVVVADLATSAVDQKDGDKKLGYEGGTIKDVVKYENLVPGVEYKVTGELMDKATGKGTGITGTAKFTPKEANGSVDVLFKVDAKQAGKTLVAFEKLHQGDLLVAVHEDINDKEQTVTVEKTPPVVNIDTGFGTISGSGLVVIGAGLAALIAAGAATTIVVRRRRAASVSPSDISGL